MRVRKVIEADKVDIELGEWKEGNMPPSYFRLHKSGKTVKQGKSYLWQIIKFSVGTQKFRVYVLFNQMKEIYRGTLGVEIKEEVKIICVHEFHIREPGWHCHSVLHSEQGVSTWMHRNLKKTPRKARSECKFHNIEQRTCYGDSTEIFQH
jgi:hypothetical protein